MFLQRILVVFAICSLWCANSIAAKGPSSSWINAARRVGQSETAQAREQSLTALRSQKNLNQKLLKALDTSDRALALDAIAALSLKELVPELLERIVRDQDGFLTLNLSSLMDETNKAQILGGYTDLIGSAQYSELSAGAIVAMLEPLGRLGETLSRDEVLKLSRHSFPEVRSATLQYLRAMALAHNDRAHDMIARDFLKSGEFQLRLQAVAFFNELLDKRLPPIYSVSQLRSSCQKEPNKIVRDECLRLLKKTKGRT